MYNSAYFNNTKLSAAYLQNGFVSFSPNNEPKLDSVLEKCSIEDSFWYNPNDTRTIFADKSNLVYPGLNNPFQFIMDKLDSFSIDRSFGNIIEPGVYNLTANLAVSFQPKITTRKPLIGIVIDYEYSNVSSKLSVTTSSTSTGAAVWLEPVYIEELGGYLVSTDVFLNFRSSVDATLTIKSAYPLLSNDAGAGATASKPILDQLSVLGDVNRAFSFNTVTNILPYSFNAPASGSSFSGTMTANRTGKLTVKVTLPGGVDKYYLSFLIKANNGTDANIRLGTVSVYSGENTFLSNLALTQTCFNNQELLVEGPVSYTTSGTNIYTFSLTFSSACDVSIKDFKISPILKKEGPVRIKFDGIDDHLKTQEKLTETSVSSSNSSSCIIAVKYNGRPFNTITNGNVFTLSSKAFNLCLNHPSTIVDGVQCPAYYSTGSNTRTYLKHTEDYDGISGNIIALMIVDSSSKKVRLRINGVESQPISVSSLSFTGNETFCVGAGKSGSPPFFSGDVYEVLGLYGNGFTEKDILDIEKYMGRNVV